MKYNTELDTQMVSVPDLELAKKCIHALEQGYNSMAFPIQNSQTLGLVRRYLRGSCQLPQIVASCSDSVPEGYTLLTFYHSQTKSRKIQYFYYDSCSNLTLELPVMAFLLCTYNKTVHTVWYMENI